ncbi:MAG: ABC transporter permease [Nitrososphaerota archaeon]|jgi:putative ABC transport system permease protein|uniref:ABC transporter permease n=1 Tax=Candidatus Bathycorpusculum sp. TaxID=2994959 RepID=UPI002829EA4B|nr:ABC transporter permease [Candidatus Termiticorpusculum sp.]MCL2257453.1 ABC transporter permease [Candidatus Termiticorpusculum sp.]MCL2292436.1 ABC transporter permease [Candidatus Termiticorpusculum sp.]MDR0461645.1 ABC transporter permease [Nitrososphaerota archaeon]
MKILDILRYAFSAIKLRKFRAFLNILGIAIGIAAIVSLLGITAGLQASITGELTQGLSANSLIVMPGGDSSGQDSPGFSIGLSGSGSGFNLYINQTSDIESLSPNITSAIAIIQRTGRIVSDDLNRSVTIYGVDYDAYAQVYPSFSAESGYIPVNPQNDDIVLGSRVVDPAQNGTQFIVPGDDVSLLWLNATVLPPVYENYTVQVSGVLGKVGGGFGLAPSDGAVYIPLSTAADFFDTDACDMIVVTLTNSDNATMTEVTNLIKTYYSGQVAVVSSDVLAAVLNSVLSYLQLFLVGIAAISLLVAGVGIMNIMMVSLIERTREIGILKALGMKSRTVLMIFLGESVILGFIGGVVGVVGGWVIANGVTWVLGSGLLGIGGNLSITPVLSPLVIFGALAFGVGISVIFALYPAWRASKLRPVDAIRHE